MISNLNKEIEFMLNMVQKELQKKLLPWKFFLNFLVNLLAEELTRISKPKGTCDLLVDKYLVYGFFALIIETSFNQSKKLIIIERIIMLFLILVELLKYLENFSILFMETK